jgi:peroxiredoxin (alkyl hydroperoxide reductase subunit C)
MGLKVGQLAPDFTLASHLDKSVTLSDLRGKNVVLAFFPMAWTPVCTHQIPAYEADIAKFSTLNTQVLGISIDHVPCLKAWAQSLGGISYPILSDFWPHGEVAKQYGVLRPEGRSERALFIIDKQGVIQYIDIHDIGKQPENDDLYRELRRIDPLAAKNAPIDLKSPAGPLPKGGIVMYCNSWCPDCKKARIWLKERHLSYTEVDINSTPGASDQVKKWANGNLTTPTFDIDGTIVVDFDEKKLAEVLKVN